MSDSAKKNTGPIHQLVDEKLFQEQLSAMTPPELTHALEQALDTMTEETYDAKLIDAYLEALDQKEPMPEIPSVEEACSRFQQHLRMFSPGSTAPTALPSAQNRPVRFRKLWRTALAAAALASFIFGGMIVAQAAGVDVFGAMARWTEETFSFGAIRIDDTESAETEAYSEVAESMEDMGDMGEGVIHQRFSSLEGALDAYYVTEVTAPSWIPEEYTLDLVDVIYLEDPGLLSIDTSYIDGKNALSITIVNYIDEPSMQVEKTETPPETFDVNGTTFYMIENTRSYTVAWLTENFECYIGGAKDMEPEVLKEIVYSMF